MLRARDGTLRDCRRAGCQWGQWSGL